MIIDEVDSATNNQVFLDFLAQLRSYYLAREDSPTFQSVILAGVYDVKNIRRKISPDEAHKANSPWNIAADFKVNMKVEELCSPAFGSPPVSFGFTQAFVVATKKTVKSNNENFFMNLSLLF